MKMRRYEVNDEQWEKIKDLLPPKKTGRPFKNLRNTFNGILWVMCTGASWRDIPERYGKWNTIYKCFAHWSNLDIFEKIFEKLSKENDFYRMVNRQHLCKSSQGGIRCKKRTLTAIGVSRAGRTSKIHIAVDEYGRPRKIILTAGNINDCDVAYELLDEFNLQGKTVIAERGYSISKIKNFIEEHGAVACIPPKSNFKKSWIYDREKYKSHNKIERFFGNLKERRHLATRYDKLASRFFSFVHLASIFSWL